MSRIESKLAELGLTLPAPPPPGGNYLPFRIEGRTLYLPGAIASRDGKIQHAGKVGGTLGIDEGYQAARLCALNLLACAKLALGDLDRIDHVISVSGFVNCTPGFPDSPKVINGASDLLVAVLGDDGRHVRAAVGVAGLPSDSATEVQMIVALK